MRNKTCMICKTTIFIGNEEFVKVKHYSEKEEVLSKGYYHIKCYKDRLNGTQQIKKLQEATLNLIKGASKKIGIEQEEVIII